MAVNAGILKAVVSFYRIAVSHFKHETFTALPYSVFGIITKKSLTSKTMGNQVFYSWKILLSCPSHRHWVCKCQLYATATFRGDQPRDWKCYERIFGEVSFIEAKDSSGRNYQGQGRGFTTGLLHKATRFHKSGIVGGTREQFQPWRLASRVQQRQRSRSSYFGRWECDRCLICWRKYRWSGSCGNMHTNMTRTQKTTFLNERIPSHMAALRISQKILLINLRTTSMAAIFRIMRTTQSFSY